MNPSNQSSATIEQTPTADYHQTAAMRNTGRWKLQREDWVWLNDGCRVRVRTEINEVVTGVVDIVAPDASIFWMWLDHGLGRIALHEDDHVTVWLEGSQNPAVQMILEKQKEFGDDEGEAGVLSHTPALIAGANNSGSDSCGTERILSTPLQYVGISGPR